MAFLVVKYAYSKQKVNVSLEDIVKSKLDSYFDEINKKYVLRGLWWRVHPGNYWVELRIESSLKKAMLKI
jgi:hypothetical protein